MPMLKKRKGEKKSQTAVRTEMTKMKSGTLHSGSKTGKKVTNPKQAIAIGLSEARKSGAKAPAKKGKAGDGDDAMLRRHGHHLAQAQKHRAHADLIEARLKTQGKRIATDYGDGIPTRRPGKIVPDVPMG